MKFENEREENGASKNAKEGEKITSEKALLELVAKELAKMELEKYRSLVDSNFGIDDPNEG